MLDHLGFSVSDYAASRDFYRQALAPLGFGIVMEVTREMSGGYEGCGFGPPGRPPARSAARTPRINCSTLARSN